MALHHIDLAEGADLAGFRKAVRGLVSAGIAPDEVLWTAGDAPLLSGASTTLDVDAALPITLPRAVGTLVEAVVCHREPERYALLYRLIWRVLHGEREVLGFHSDPLIHRLALLDKAVRRDLHKMHAFLRFHEFPAADGGERFVAFFEPDHFIIQAAAPFFVERFQSMDWSILTPVGSLHWDWNTLTVGPPAAMPDGMGADAFQAGWKRYYESTFNPARLNPVAMRAEMPKRYWAHMPEAESIPKMIREAPARVRSMIEREAAAPIRRNPDRAVAAMASSRPASLEDLNSIIRRSPPLVPGATQAVLGEGPQNAAIAFVGEQPGDQEDLQGRPFVGPAGQLLDRAMAEAGVERGAAYMTNAVKHFKFVLRGKRRIHQSPTAGEVKHYRWWLMEELRFVRPRLIVALGAAAALALAGRKVSVLHERGPARFGDWNGFVTVHPSYLLRLPDEEQRSSAYGAFVDELRRARDLASAPVT